MYSNHFDATYVLTTVKLLKVEVYIRTYMNA